MPLQCHHRALNEVGFRISKFSNRSR
jgi:hypothetical protein